MCFVKTVASMDDFAFFCCIFMPVVGESQRFCGVDWYQHPRNIGPLLSDQILKRTLISTHKQVASKVAFSQVQRSMRCLYRFHHRERGMEIPVLSRIARYS